MLSLHLESFSSVFVYLLTHSWLITFLYYTNMCLILKSVYESCMNDIKCKKLHLKLRVKYVIIINIFTLI